MDFLGGRGNLMVGSSSSLEGEDTGGILGRESPDSTILGNKDLIFLFT